MNMQRQVGDISVFMQDLELQRLLGKVKMTVKQNFPEIVIDSLKMPEGKEGDLLEIPRWAAEIFVGLGFAEIQEESFEVEMLKTLSRERIQDSNRLSTLTSDVYLKLKSYLKGLKDNAHLSGTLKHDYDEAYMKALDLITLRTVKLLPLTVGEYAPDIMQRLTPEEIKLFKVVREIVQHWKYTILEGSEVE
jgi:DNA replication factor GINS